MKLTKRLTAIFLCFLIVFSALPAQIFATEEVSQVEEAEELSQPIAVENDTESGESENEFVFVEPGKEDDAPIGDVIITNKGYRIQLNPDEESYTILEYIGSDSDVVILSEHNGLPITRIASYAFSNKSGLKTVRIPETVNRMEQGIFDGCEALTYHIYENGKYLGSENNAYYYYCGPVNEVKITITEATMHPDTKIVAAFAFRDCDTLRSVIIPDGVKQIGYGMVQGCELESITLPFVGECGTTKNSQFGWPFGARSFGGNISYVPLSLKSVVITGGTDGKQGIIVKGAFFGVDMIEDITLPFLGGSFKSPINTFISWYWGADRYNENILPPSVKNITISNSDYISNSAFYNCSKLESVVIPKNVT